MLCSVEQAFAGRDEKRAPLKRPAWEASRSTDGLKFMKSASVYFCPKMFHTNIRCLSPSPLNAQLRLSRRKVNMLTARKNGKCYYLS